MEVIQNRFSNEAQAAPVVLESSKALAAHSNWVMGAQLFALQGKPCALSWSSDKTLCVWDLKTATLLRQLTGHISEVWHVEIFDLKERVHAASLSMDGNCRVWDLESGASTPLFQLVSGWGAGIRSFSINGEPRILSWCSVRGSVASRSLGIWDPGSCTQLAVLDGHTESVQGAEIFILDGEVRVLSWASDGLACTWNAESGALMTRLEKHTKKITGAQFYELQDGDARILTWSEDGTQCVWNARSDELLNWLEGHPRGEKGGKLFELKHKLHLLSWRSNTGLFIWKIGQGEEKPVVDLVPKHSLTVRDALVLRWHGEVQVLTWSYDKTLRLWNAETGEGMMQWVGHTKSVVGARPCAIGNQLGVLSWSEDGTLRLWNAENGASLRACVGHTAEVYGAQFVNFDGKSHILSWSHDGTLRLWDL